ncbi:hypothetical protein GDO81_020029 [Engystomops pustulosus]|uniref:Uncharacterized protein n=1 Tax=Engystomops pustulosus TaxID=76066 RepID=A0AAV6Z1Z4_ENGPU|nr:hypothetical protein GDO81_020029 [Engystomops pustulosus]
MLAQIPCPRSIIPHSNSGEGSGGGGDGVEWMGACRRGGRMIYCWSHTPKDLGSRACKKSFVDFLLLKCQVFPLSLVFGACLQAPGFIQLNAAAHAVLIEIPHPSLLTRTLSSEEMETVISPEDLWEIKCGSSLKQRPSEPSARLGRFLG